MTNLQSIIQEQIEVWFFSCFLVLKTSPLKIEDASMQNKVEETGEKEGMKIQRCATSLRSVREAEPQSGCSGGEKRTWWCWWWAEEEMVVEEERGGERGGRGESTCVKVLAIFCFTLPSLQ